MPDAPVDEMLVPFRLDRNDAREAVHWLALVGGERVGVTLYRFRSAHTLCGIAVVEPNAGHLHMAHLLGNWQAADVDCGGCLAVYDPHAAVEAAEAFVRAVALSPAT